MKLDFEVNLSIVITFTIVLEQGPLNCTTSFSLPFWTLGDSFPQVDPFNVHLLRCMSGYLESLWVQHLLFITPLSYCFCTVYDGNFCDPDPCVNGTCTDLILEYRCDCHSGYGGNNCSSTTYIYLKVNKIIISWWVN